ncbi:MAG: hypothetical protein LBQ02_03570 [Candidatus Nomurabacteria bacterium]|jgi:hypothetical protein|nr:hypothetical protein [Candidatus Nomurabacteria bacterium]
MPDEICLQNELTFDGYQNTVGPEIMVAKLHGGVLMTAKMLANAILEKLGITK